MFEPSPAEFVPSQQRGPDVAVYRIPGNPEFCYEWSFKKLLSDRETGTYICCGCRSLKARDCLTYRDPLPLCKIRDGYFITDPCSPVRPHFCSPRSTPDVAMRRMVIRKCNDLREDIERRPTSSVVDELIGEVSGDGFDELSESDKQLLLEKLTHMSDSASKTLTRVFQWNMQKAQSPVAEIAGEEMKMKCSLCDKEQFKGKFAPIPSKKVGNVILLSCLSRYNVISLEDAKKQYKELFATRKRICKEHFVQAVLFLGWEMEQLCGHFPMGGLDEAPPFAMCALLNNLRYFRSLLDDSMPVERKDIREFFNEYLLEFHNEVVEKISATNSLEAAQFLEVTANFGLKKEEDALTPSISVTEQLPNVTGPSPSTAERDAASPDFFIPKAEPEDSEPECLIQDCIEPSSSTSNEVEAKQVAVDLYWSLSCLLCSKPRLRTELRVVSKRPQRNVVLLACLLANGTFDQNSVFRHYCEIADTKQTQKRTCKEHYVEAAKFLQEELKKVPECIPNEAKIPLFIPAPLVQLIHEKAAVIDKTVIVHERDLALFYSDCLNKYHNGKEWFLEGGEHVGPPNTMYKTTATFVRRKRRLEDVEQPISCPPNITPKDPPVQNNSDFSCLGFNKDLPHCVICFCNRQQSEFCKTTLRTDQHLIFLSCLVLNDSMKANVARQVLKEMVREVQFVCKQHFMLAMLYIYRTIKAKWNLMATPTFAALPDYAKMELLERIRECADKIQRGFRNMEITEEFLEIFYNRCETKFCVMGRLQARDMRKKEEDSSKEVGNSYMQEGSTADRKGSETSGCPILISNCSKKSTAEFATDANKQRNCPSSSCMEIPFCPRWSIQRTNPEKRPRRGVLTCGLCRTGRHSSDLRKVSTMIGRTNTLLACLLRQGLISTETAKNFYEDQSRDTKRICSEHFIHAGAYLGFIAQQLSGQRPIYGLCNVTNDMLSSIVKALQEHINEINNSDTLTANDITSFFNDYLLKYLENDDWDIREVPENEWGKTAPPPPSSLGYGEEGKSVGEDEPLFSNESIQNRTCKMEEGEQPSLVITGATRINGSTKKQPLPDSESWKNRCGICDYRGKTGLRRPSLSRNYNIILLACLIMDKSIEVSQSTDLFWKIINFTVMICEKHLTDAAHRIEEEVQRLWGRKPGDGLDDVPYAEMCQLVDIIKSHASRIDLGKKSLVRITDVKDFYDLCQSLRTETESSESLQDGLEEVIALDKSERQQRKTQNPNVIVPVPVVFSRTDERGSNLDEKLEKAFENVCDDGSAIPEEVPAVALLQHTMSHVDESLGTSGNSVDLLSHIGDSLGKSAKSRKVGPVAAVHISGRSYPFASNAEPVDLKPVALFHFRQGLSAKMTTAEIVSTFGEDSIADYQVTEWYDEFYQKYHHVGCAATSAQSQAQNRLIRALLEADPNKTIPQLAQEFGTSVEVMVSYLRMNGILRSVKRTVLNERQRRNRMEICSGLIYRHERDPTFLDRIVTYGEVWVGTAGRKEASTMVAVWWTPSGVVHFYVVPEGKMTSQLYFYHVTEMHKKLLKMRGEEQDLIMLHDNQLPYISLGAIRAIHQLGYEILQLPERCSDLLPTDYHFVPHFRQFLIGRVFCSDFQLTRCFNVFMLSKDVHFYSSGIHDLVERWKKCFDASGDYFKP